MIRKLLCKLGFHHWIDNFAPEMRGWGLWSAKCSHCGVVEIDSGRDR
jgi:hypothetical protein